jgi:hypothetical protein
MLSCMKPRKYDVMHQFLQMILHATKRRLSLLWLPKKLNISAAKVGPNSLYLRVEIESTDNQRKYGVRALVDSGATGLFIN